MFLDYFYIIKLHSIIIYSKCNLLYFQPPELSNINFTLGHKFNKESNACIQNWDFKTGKEDCLYLNIFTPVTKSKRFDLKSNEFPVFFWIHGGSYNAGSASSDNGGPQLIIEKDIIVVTINYRLGVLGFLSIPEANITGNFGLRDQQIALKWTHKNIGFFGGDSNALTIVGWSAGAASTSFHLYSKEMNGLFSKAIMMSGTMLNPWAYFGNRSFCLDQFIKSLPRNTSNISILKNLNYAEIKSYLKNLNEQIFFNLPQTFSRFTYHDFAYTYASFIPTAELNSHPHPIITENPSTFIKNPKFINNVPILLGFTSREDEYSILWNLFINKWRINKPRKTNPGIELSKYNELMKYIKYQFTSWDHRQKYLKSLEIPNLDSTRSYNYLVSRLAVYSDAIYGIKNFANLYKNQTDSNVFMYKFSHEGDFSCKVIMPEEANITFIRGPSHGDDLGYIFLPNCAINRDNTNNTKRYEMDFKIRSKMVNMWTNFIKFG